MKSVFRQIQTWFPWLHNLRFELKFLVMARLKKPHEPDFVGLKDFLYFPGELALDVGANRGEAHWSMRLFLPKSMEIHSFEPNPLVAGLLEKRVKHWPGAVVYQAGLGEKAKSETLFVPFYRKWMFDGLASYDKVEAAGWLKGRLWGYREKHFSLKKLRTEQWKLDDLKLNPGFIKLDVQGWEQEVLHGGWQTLVEHKPVLMVEAIPENCLEALKAIGYAFWYWEKGKWTAGTSPINTFAVPENRWLPNRRPG